MTRLLVTGAAGSIGRSFIRGSLQRYELRLADRGLPEDEQLRGAGDWLCGDLAHMDFARQCVEGIEVVLHLAAIPSPRASFEQLLPANIVATYNTMQAALEAGVRRVVFASTIQTVYGYPEELTVTPDMAAHPVNLYGASKAWGEALCSVYSRQGMSCCAVRIGAFAHPSYVGKLGRRAMLTEFVAPDDLARLFQLIIDCEQDLGFQVFHGLSETPDKRFDDSNARELLGYKPKYTSVLVDEAAKTGQ